MNPQVAAGPAAVAGAARPRFGEVTIRDRGYLPHWEKDGGVYFVTFRLADSLPVHVRETIRERRRVLQQARQSGRELLAVEAEALKHTTSASIERYLDSGIGSCVMRNVRIAAVVAETIAFWETKRYQLHAWCVMPNHVHFVLGLFPGIALERVVSTWKSYTAKKANLMLGKTGAFWMREYYDRLIRNPDEFDRAVSYVPANPERAGLREWRWVGRDGAAVHVP